MKASNRNIRNAIAKAEKLRGGKPKASKYELKNRRTPVEYDAPEGKDQ